MRWKICDRGRGRKNAATVFYHAEIERRSITGIYSVGNLHIRGRRYNSSFYSAVRIVYDFQPRDVHSE